MLWYNQSSTFPIQRNIGDPHMPPLSCFLGHYQWNCHRAIILAKCCYLLTVLHFAKSQVFSILPLK
uniref:Putative ovule protein n=1 Tax=Solanum chacoense TaxID=4108 RepID=A0A0V0GSU1_SOLCH